MALLSPSEIGKQCGLSASQIRRLIRQKVIKAEKVGAFYVVNDKYIKTIKRQRKLSITKEV